MKNNEKIVNERTFSNGFIVYSILVEVMVLVGKAEIMVAILISVFHLCLTSKCMKSMLRRYMASM